MARKFYRALPKHVSLEDLEQIARLGLVEAALKYDPTSAASFRTWAGMRIQANLVENVRSTLGRNGGRAGLAYAASFSQPQGEEGNMTLGDRIQDRADYTQQVLLRDALQGLDLTEQEAQVLHGIACSERKKQLAETMGVTQSRVSQHVGSIHKKMVAAGIEPSYN